MKAILGGVLGGVLIVVVIVLGVDLAAAPPSPGKGTCVFQNRILLPDRCLSGCTGCPECPTAATRPYLIFWTEAVTCPDFCLCGGSARRPLLRPENCS